MIVEKTTAGIDQTTRRMFYFGILSFHVTMLNYRTIAQKVLWEFDYIIIQNLSDILSLFCTTTWPSHRRVQEVTSWFHTRDRHPYFFKNKTKCLHKKCSVPRGLLWSPIASWRSWSPIETTNTGIHPVEVYVFGGKSGYCITIYFSGAIFDLPPIVKRLDTPIEQINHQPLGKSYQDPLSYPVDSDLCCSIYPLNYWRREFRPIDGKMAVNRELSKDVVDNSKNVIWKTWRFCSHFSIIQSHYAGKICCNYPGITLEPALPRAWPRSWHKERASIA